MADQPFDHRRRSSVAMYDPARDIFTATEDAVDEPGSTPESTWRSSPVQDTQHQEPKPDSNLVADGQQINGSTPSRATPNTAVPQRDLHYTVQSPDTFKEKDIKAKSPPHPTAAEETLAKPRISSPRVSSHTSSPHHPRIHSSDPMAAAPPIKKRKLSPTSTRSPYGRSSERGTPPPRKRDRSASKDTQENGDIKRVREGLEKSTSSKRRVPEKASRRPRNEVSVYARRDTPPPRERSRSPRGRTPDYRDRSRSPRPISRSRSRSPPRQRKKPGGAARITPAQKEAFRQRQLEREEAEQRKGQEIAQQRGTYDVVRQHYNMVPERGREWRKTDSRIKGLRSFNNWIKSTIIQKFSPNEDFVSHGEKDWGSNYSDHGPVEEKGLLVMDIGCGKGGDLGKWQQAPQSLDLYVGLDPADVSISQARERYGQMRGGRGPRRGKQVFDARFFVKDCFGESLGDVQFIQEVGYDPNVGPGGNMMASRWGPGGGFDVVSMMFCMHYAFETEEKARGMLRNVAGSLKKGGRFIGVIPNSDVLSSKVRQFHDKRKQKENEKTSDENEEGEVEEEEVPEWSNSIYRVRFPGKTPEDGIFRPPFGWRYSYFLEEAVEEVPEYVVPWEAFRAMTEDYNLELQYRRPFSEIWREEKDDRTLGPLSERMGVRGRDRGPLLVSDDEMDAASFYHAFCFYKV